MHFFIFHFLFALVITVISALVTQYLSRHLSSMDVPNERSAHTKATPRGGGIAILVAFLTGILLIQFVGDSAPIRAGYFLGFLAAALVIGAMSLYDDFHPVSAVVKLLGQVTAVVCVMAAGMLIDTVRLPLAGEFQIGFIAYPVTFFWLLGLANAYNFMDGLDGLAASTAVIAAAFFAYISFSQGSSFIYLASLTIAAASLGFMLFNWQPAKIFMGDVGSVFLGFTFAAMAVIAAQYDHSHTSFFVLPMLLLHFIFDSTFTFVRRLYAGENVFQGHRTHIYQLLNRMGYSHRRVASIYALAAVTQGVAAVWMVKNLGEERLYVFVPFLVCYLIVAVLVLSRARRFGVIA